MNGQLRIKSMFAFVVVDDDGTEGVLGARTPEGWMPLVGADLARVESLRPHAEMLAGALGKPVTLLHFETRVEVEVIEPRRPHVESTAGPAGRCPPYDVGFRSREEGSTR